MKASPLQAKSARIAHSPRAAAAAALFGLVAVASYAAQRLASHFLGEVPASAIVEQAHIPFFWRVAVSLLHGGIAALLVGFGLREQTASRVVKRLPLLLWPILLLAGIAMVLVP